MTAAIEVTGLRKSFGGRTVLDGIGFDVARGEIFAVLGPNGAGKTTTVGILTTLVKPDAGTVRVCGIDVARDPAAVTRRISLTGQSAAVDDVLSGRENLIMMGRLSGLATRRARAAADELLERFDLVGAARSRVSTYSGGMRRRLDLALSLVVTPEVLFLDEPTTGLDTRSRRELWDAIRSLAGGGTTVLMTTQYLEEADLLADRIAVISDGRIAALGTAAELKARVGGATVEIHGPDGAVIERAPTDGTVAGVRRALDTVHAEGVVDIHRPTLDDVFLSLTTRALDHEARPTALESA